jgi:hypothetical protein
LSHSSLSLSFLRAEVSKYFITYLGAFGQRLQKYFNKSFSTKIHYEKKTKTKTGRALE